MNRLKGVLADVLLQGDLVHQLKEKGATEQELSRAVAELKARKKALEAKVKGVLFPDFQFPPE